MYWFGDGGVAAVAAFWGELLKVLFKVDRWMEGSIARGGCQKLVIGGG